MKIHPGGAMATIKFADFAAFGVAGLLLGLVLVPFAMSRIPGAESQSVHRNDLPSIELPQRPPTVGKSIPLNIHGVSLGTAVVYKNPSIGTPGDYLEFYNPTGNLIAVVWFDRFGIRRAAVDRSFLRGKNQPEGVFVPVEDGELI
jgi:hypothetical protein